MGADLSSVDFRKADLEGARDLTQTQLGRALTDETTILPNGSRGPYMRRSGAERPVYHWTPLEEEPDGVSG
jgi:hypothetical protein